ncbi:pseudouridine synthase, partial [Rheinheimera sp.]|uniref:pseudouridine synthase n=1 Tax=Rheinheimera sp. TaxID=1869214 RepID=UPI003AF64CF6
VNECLLQRLKEDTGISDLAPLHRLDRDTAGLVLFSCNSISRPHYYQLFQQGQLAKRYQARARLSANLQPPLSWQLSNRIEKAQPRFINQIVPGEANAHSIIELVGVEGDIGQFQLQPLTGKTHQLRLHMLSLGMPILNDAYYPELLPKNTSDFSRPLQLLAQQLSFIDPLSQRQQHFVSQQALF